MNRVSLTPDEAALEMDVSATEEAAEEAAEEYAEDVSMNHPFAEQCSSSSCKRPSKLEITFIIDNTT